MGSRPSLLQVGLAEQGWELVSASSFALEAVDR